MDMPLRDAAMTALMSTNDDTMENVRFSTASPTP